jgi:hypothetical protein
MRAFFPLTRGRGTPAWVYFRGNTDALAAGVSNYVFETGLSSRVETALRLHRIVLEFGTLPAGANFTVGERVTIQLQRKYTAPAALITSHQRDLLFNYQIYKQDETQVGFQYWEAIKTFWFDLDEPDSLIVQPDIAFVAFCSGAANVSCQYKVLAEYVDISRIDKLELLGLDQ